MARDRALKNKDKKRKMMLTKMQKMYGVVIVVAIESPFDFVAAANALFLLLLCLLHGN